MGSLIKIHYQDILSDALSTYKVGIVACHFASINNLDGYNEVSYDDSI